MDLKARLKRMMPPESGTLQRDRAQLGKQTLDGEERTCDLGTYWISTVDHPLHRNHGERSLKALLSVDSGRLALAAQDSALERFSPKSAVFLDTETTALGGGAGVYVFMAGIGFVHGDLFSVEQYFMRDYDEEPAMLHALNERLRSFTGLVSFFGKNFDRYRLEDRMAALGVDSALPVDCHLDLYHVGRRFYQGRFSNLKLKTLEKRVLGFGRKGDIPGAECPEAYFSYLEGDRSGRINEVFLHNFWDILSLASLTVEIDSLVREPRSAQDRYILACCCLKTGRSTQALSLLEAACRAKPSIAWAFDAHLKLIRLLKREKSPRLGRIVKRLVEHNPDNPQALTEMAKFLEHDSRNFFEALIYAEKALAGLQRWDEGNARSARLIHEGRRRVDRLKLRAGNSGMI